MSKSKDPVLSLGCSLRNDLISTLTKLSALIESPSAKIETKKELAKTISSLVQRLSALFSSDNEGKIKENLSIIDENLLDDLKNEYGLTFEISWQVRRDLVDLLMDNFNSVLLFTSTEANNKNLLEENNYLIHLLTDLKAKPSSGSSALQSELEGQQAKPDIDQLTCDIKNNNDQIANLLKNNNDLTTKLLDLTLSERSFDQGLSNEHDQESYLKGVEMEIIKRTGLKIRISEIDTRTNRASFDFEMDGIDEFLSSSRKVHSELFNYFDVLWLYLELTPKIMLNGIPHLGVFLCSINKEYWSQILNFELKISNPSNDSLFKSHFFTNKLFQKGTCESNGLNTFISYSNLNELISNDTIKLSAYIKIDNDD